MELFQLFGASRGIQQAFTVFERSDAYYFEIEGIGKIADSLRGEESILWCCSPKVAGCKVREVFEEDFYTWETGCCCGGEFIWELVDPGSLLSVSCEPGHKKISLTPNDKLAIAGLYDMFTGSL